MTGKEVSLLMDELHRIHRQIGDINHRAKRLKQTLLGLTAELESAKASVKEKNDVKQKLLLDVKEKERDAALGAQNLQRRQEQLNMAKSDREYQTIKLQIELESKKSDSLADAALVALSAVDKADEEIKSSEKAVELAQEKLRSFKSKLAEETPVLKADMERTTGRLRDAESRLPHEFAGLYASCVKKYGGQESLAPIVDDVYCGSCNIQIPLDDVLKIQSGSPFCCFSCGRLLFMPPQLSNE